MVLVRMMFIYKVQKARRKSNLCYTFTDMNNLIANKFELQIEISRI